MDVRGKLLELLDNAIVDSDDNYGFPNTNQVADHLIAHGVTVFDEPIKMVMPEGVDEKQFKKMTHNEPLQIFPCEPMQEWIPVNDRLPDVDGKYLVARATGDRYSISVRKFRKEVPCWYTGYCGHWERRTNGITHWMPLPQPPKGE